MGSVETRPIGKGMAMRFAVILLLALIMSISALAACTSSDSSEDSDSDSAASSSASTDSGGISSSSSDSGASSSGSGDDGTVSNTNQNPDGLGPVLNYDANLALAGSAPAGLITWSEPPALAPGELSGAGTVTGGGQLFLPPGEDDGAMFLVFYKGHDEPMVALLPDLGPMEQWNTDLTVAPMDFEYEAGTFSFRAYSPLFMDTDPTDLELRAYGYGSDGSPTILDITDLAGQ